MLINTHNNTHENGVRGSVLVRMMRRRKVGPWASKVVAMRARGRDRGRRCLWRGGRGFWEDV